RRGMPHAPLDGFAAQLLRWDEGGDLPDARTPSEKLMLFRAALRHRRDAIAAQLAAQLRIDRATTGQPASESELRILRAAAALPFPFDKRDFSPTPWRFAARNRLGQWQEIGSMPGLSGAELDAILAVPPEDWIVCSDRELLFADGLSDW